MTYLSFIKKYPRQLGFGFTHSFFSAMGQTFIFALFVPEFEQTFNLSPAQSGSYYGIVTLISGFLLFYTGSLIDKVNLRHYATVVVLCMAAGAFLMASATHVAVFLVAMLLLRHAGQALMVHIGKVGISKYFIQNRGKGLSIVGMGISLSSMFFPFFTAQIIESYGWQTAYIILGSLTLTACLSLSYGAFKKEEKFLHPHLEDDEAHPAFLEQDELNWGRKQLVSHPHFWMILPLVLLPGYVITAFTFHQGMIANMQGWTMQHIAAAFIAYGIGSFAMNIAIGPLIDKFTGTTMQKFMLVPFMAAAGVLFIGNHPAWAYIYLSLSGMGVGASSATFAMWTEVYGRKHVGAIKSFVGTLIIFGTAAAPVVFGYMVEHGLTLPETILAHIVVMVGATILAVMAPLPNQQKLK